MPRNDSGDLSDESDDVPNITNDQTQILTDQGKLLANKLQEINLEHKTKFMPSTSAFSGTTMNSTHEKMAGFQSTNIGRVASHAYKSIPHPMLDQRNEFFVHPKSNSLMPEVPTTSRNKLVAEP